MARALTAAHLLCGLTMILGPCVALAMGPGAPFSPPAPAQAAIESAPQADEISSVGLRGIKRGKRPQALIDGNWVSRGATVRDDVVLLEIEQYAVRLKHADGTVERLALSPDVEMSRSSRHVPTSRRMP